MPTTTTAANRIECPCSYCNGKAALVADTTLAYLDSRPARKRYEAVHGFVTLAHSPLGRMQAARNPQSPTAA